MRQNTNRTGADPQVRHGGDPAVIVVEGAVDDSEALVIDTLLRAAEPPDGREPRLVVDLARVTSLSSAGLDVLLSAQQRLESRGGTLELREPSAEVVLLLHDALDGGPGSAERPACAG